MLGEVSVIRKAGFYVLKFNNGATEVAKAVCAWSKYGVCHTGVLSRITLANLQRQLKYQAGIQNQRIGYEPS